MKVTYEELERDIKELIAAHEEELAGIEFIVGVSRGGLFPAMVVSTTLVKPLVAAYINKQDEVFFDRADWIKGKSVLVVDDIVRTGKTLDKIKKLVHAKGAREVRTLTPYYLIQTPWSKPHYGHHRTEDVIFPWDETVTVESNLSADEV